MNKITLSIVIPTFNRAQLLSMLLDSIVRDMVQLPCDLELVISDNASSDSTSKVVAGYISRGFAIDYRVNDINIGADANVASCFDLATGKYLWVIGDDELLYRGTVQYVLDICRSKKFGILHLNSNSFLHGQQPDVCTRALPEVVEAEELNSKSLFRRANIFLTFISANIINREAILDSMPGFNSKAELNSNLPQLAWTYSAIKSASVHCHVITPMLGVLGGNTSGYKLIEVFGVNLLNITQKYLRETIPHAERIMSNAVITRVIASEVMSQFRTSARKNEFEEENLREAADKCFGNRFYHQYLLRAILSHSAIKRNIAFFFVRVVNRLNYQLGYVLL